MSFPELYILRHGETVWNAEGRMQGAVLDSPLTAKGRAQAARQGQLLGNCDLTGFVAISSPLGRALETAAIAVSPFVATIGTDDRLREIGVGDWQGVQRDTLVFDGDPLMTPDGPLALSINAPNGEGLAALEARCCAFLSDLTHPVVLVTHGITSRMLRRIVLGLDHSGFVSLAGGQGNVFHLKDGKQTELK